ncbi:MAG: TauD/TfdA family dioxygenase [Pseudomonadota bacterium]
MSSTEMTVSPVAGALGADVHGVNLSEPMGDNLFKAVNDALLEHQVLFFHDQEITPDQQIGFAKRFGDIHYHPYISGMPDHPEIVEIIKTESESKNFGGSWHSDQMFNRCPAKLTMLYAKEVPEAGGDTLFASMYAAHDALSDGMRKMLGELHTFNVGDRFKNQGGKTRREVMTGTSSMRLKDPDPDQDTEAVHPTLRTHPETGRKALYIGGHTHRFDELTDEESEGLLDYLRKYSVRPEFTCRFRWKRNSLALWDNRCTQHFAVNDYAGKRRVMHRITIAGDATF